MQNIGGHHAVIAINTFETQIHFLQEKAVGTIKIVRKKEEKILKP
jgi:hypothetical protein